MLTANDIQNITFSKSMSGYKATEVNVFIDQCAKTVDTLTKEKEDLEKKLEILADRLVEYREDEDSIRSALLNAHKLGDTTVREANHKAGMILEDANKKADDIIKEADESSERLINEADGYAETIKDRSEKSVESNKTLLHDLEKEVSNFKSMVLSLYEKHLILLDKLPEVEEEIFEVESIPEETQDNIIEESEELKAEELEAEDIEEEIEDIEEEDQIVDDTVTKAASIGIENGVAVLEEAETVTVVKPKLKNHKDYKEENTEKIEKKFKNLKFGEDYDIKKDPDLKEEGSGFFRGRK